MFDVCKQVSARVLDSEGVSDGEYFLVDDVLCSSERRIPSRRLADGLWACSLERYGCSASAAETAARDERLAAGGTNRIGHQLKSSAVGCFRPKRELCPLKRRGGEALMRREVESLRPLFFPEHLLSGSDYGREMLIRARSGHLSVRNYPRLQREISRVLDIPVQITN